MRGCYVSNTVEPPLTAASSSPTATFFWRKVHTLTDFFKLLLYNGRFLLFPRWEMWRGSTVRKGDKSLIPLTYSPLILINFSWRTNLQMFGCNVVFTIRSNLQVLIFGRFDPNCLFCFEIKHDATIFEIKLSCVSFAQHSRIFLVGSSSLFHNQNDSAKLHSVFEIPLFAAPTKVALSFIGKASAFYLVIPNSCTPCGWPLWVL